MTRDAGDGASALIEHSGKIILVILCGFVSLAALVLISENMGAGQPSIYIAVMAVVVSVLLSLGWAARTADPVEFYVSGRQLSPSVNALAGMAGWPAIPVFTAFAAVLYSFGFDGLAFAIGPLLGLFVAGVMITPGLAASKAATVPGFLALRFGSTARVISALIIATVSFVVFAAALASAAGLAAQIFAIPLPLAAGATACLAAACLLPGGMNSLTWMGVVCALLLVVTLAGTTVAISVTGFDRIVPAVASAEALHALSNLEFSMIEKGVAEAAQLKPHAKPFLQIDAANFFGLIFSLMAATAMLPHLLQRSLTVPSQRAARSTAAWLLAAAAGAVLCASAWAIFAKFEIYTLIDKGTPFAGLPDWAAQLSSVDALRIHGVSVRLIDEVTAAVRAGAVTPIHVTDALRDHSASIQTAWAGVKEPVKAALIEVVRSLPLDATPDAAWQALREKVLPLAAIAAGNKSGLVTLSSLKIDSEALMHNMPALFSLPASASALTHISFLAGAIAIASAALFNAAAVLSRDLLARAPGAGMTPSQTQVARGMIVVLAAAGAVLILATNIDWQSLVALSLTSAAGALFVALIFGIWWQRTNAMGAVLAMVSGLAIALAYAAGTKYFPVALYDIWPSASDALPAAIKRLEALRAALASSQGDTARVTQAAVDVQAAGTPLKPGVANWAGLGGACALVFAVPVSVVFLVLGTLIGPRPTQSQKEFVKSLHRPPGSDDTPVWSR